MHASGNAVTTYLDLCTHTVQKLRVVLTLLGVVSVSKTEVHFSLQFHYIYMLNENLNSTHTFTDEYSIMITVLAAITA